MKRKFIIILMTLIMTLSLSSCSLKDWLFGKTDGPAWEEPSTSIPSVTDDNVSSIPSIDIPSTKTSESISIPSVKPTVCEHTDYATVSVAPTCEAAGYEYDECSLCHQKFNYVKTQDAIGHKYYTTHVNMTCQEHGKTISVCRLCGDTIEKDLGLGEHSFRNVITPANCMHGKIITSTCIYCGLTKTSESVERGNHEYVTIFSDDATCQKTGSFVKECKFCHAWYRGDEEKGPHDYEVVTEYATYVVDFKVELTYPNTFKGSYIIKGATIFDSIPRQKINWLESTYDFILIYQENSYAYKMKSTLINLLFYEEVLGNGNVSMVNSYLLNMAYDGLEHVIYDENYRKLTVKISEQIVSTVYKCKTCGETKTEEYI